MKGSFKFILRDENDLAYKWVKEKRNVPNQNIKGGISLYALGEYFFNVFYLNKLSSFTNANEITRLIKDTNKNKDWLSFGEEWIIGLKRSFSAKKLQVMKIGIQNRVMTKLKNASISTPYGKGRGGNHRSPRRR